MRKSEHSEGQKAFQALMKGARKGAGLTQGQLARRLRRPQSFVAKYENGERRLDVVEFVEIARKLGADPVALLRSLVRRADFKSPAKL
jgi:transcriptional regulator with XRE-family HTH domain